MLFELVKMARQPGFSRKLSTLPQHLRNFIQPQAAQAQAAQQAQQAIVWEGGMPARQLQVGKHYRGRDGVVYTITQNNPGQPIGVSM